MMRPSIFVARPSRGPGLISFKNRFLQALTALFALMAAARADVVIETNSVWRFFRGTNEASSPLGTEWRTNTFDDSSWETGQAPFYFGDNYSPAGGTLLSDMQSNYNCIFLRSTFVVPPGLAVIGLSNRPYAEDGYILWINGVEVRRFDVFGASGTFLPYYTNANINAFSAGWVNLNAFTNQLRPGTNLVAMQVFNVSWTNAPGDFFANPETAVAVIDTTPPRVVSAVPPFGATVSSLREVTVTFNRPVTGVNVDDFVVSGEPATGVSGSNTTYTFTFPQPASPNVAIGWDANQVIVNAAGVRMIGESNTWTYTIVDTAPPLVAQLTPAAGSVVGSLGQVVVTFDEPVSGVDAGDLLVNGVPASIAFGSAQGPYTFQFPQPASGVVQLAWAAGHGIRDMASPANAFAGSNWTVTLNPQLFTGNVIINEFAAANILSQSALDFSEFNVPEDWIELYNRGTNAVRLLGWSLSDDQDEPRVWNFPDVTLTNGQYLVVYASGLDRRVLGGTNRLHTNFKLNPFGSYLGLFNAEYPPKATSEFAPEYPEQRNDYSFGLVSSNQWRYFTTPTPGAVNGASTITQVAPKPNVNVSRGYFDKPFTLIATCELPGATIRYTTDGSEPTAVTGFAYTGPMVISNSTVLRLVAFATNTLPSKATTHTYLFIDSVLRQSNNPGPSFPNTFGTQGTFVSPSDYEMDPEIMTNAAYVNLVTNALLSLPVVSLAIKPADMWDPTSGIYTHPLSRGVQWEKPCSLEFFSPDGSEEDFQEDAGLQVQGNASREPLKQPKHPLKVQFKGDYGPANLKHKVFPDSPREEFDSVNLRVDFNFSWLHWDGNQRTRGQRTRDAWMKDSMRALGGLAGHNRYVHLYINGVYWGVCDPSERPDASFAAAYLGGEKEDYDAINEAQTAVDGDIVALNKLLALPAATTIQQYDQFKQYLDVTQFIDYLVLHFFVGHEDWGYRKNFYAVRRRAAGEGFKYIPWDGENIMGPDVNRNDVTRSAGGTSDTTGTPSELQPKLMASSQYRLDFADRVHRHFFNNGALMPTNTIARWMNRAKQIDLAIILESARWGDYRRDVHIYQNAPYELYERNVQWLAEQGRLVNTYLPQRTAIVLNQLRAQGLYPNNTAPVFSQHGGRIAPGFALTMTATNTIYYTLNGADPRVYGTGAVSPLSQSYTGAITLNESTVVKARTRAGTNWSALTEATFVVNSLVSPLRITEIMYNPIGGDQYEYLELQNTGTTPLDLGNHHFIGITFNFPIGFTLNAGQRILLGNGLNTNAFVARYPGVPVAGWFGGALANNNGESIAVLDSLDRVVTSVTFNDRNGWVSAPDGAGYSLELVDVNGDPDDAANWRASSAQNGTPGQPNSVSPPPLLVLNEVMADNVSAVNHEGTFPDFVELFNPTVNPIDLTSWSLTDDSFPRKYVFPNGTTVPAGGYLVVWCDTNGVTSGLHSGFALGRNGETVSLYDSSSERVDSISFGPQVANFTVGRVVGNWTLTTASPGIANVAAPLAAASSLSINEWLADSVPGADDFIELFNTNATAAVALKNLYLGVSNEIYQIKSLSFVGARGYIPLLADGNAGADHLNFKLPAAGATIALYDYNGSELQRVVYGLQSQGVSQGRFPDGATNTPFTFFAGSVSPGTTNYVINYTGPVINEVLARNASAVSGPWGNYADYLELYNPNPTNYPLGGFGLSDEAGRIKFVFAPGTTIAANGYLLVWCDSGHAVSSNGTFNAGFSLSASSGGAYLFNSGGQLVNFVEYGFQVRDLPIGLSGGQWRLLSAATPAAANAAAATLGASGNLRINEWMAAAESDDWLELHNLDASPVALSGLFLTDDPSLAGLSNTPIAALSFIGGKDFVQWIADETPSAGRDHTRFDLDQDGDNIRLYDGNFSIIDSVSFGAQLPNVSQGRLPDGTSNIVSFPASATPDASNYLPLPDVVINEALTHTDLPLKDSIEIQNIGPSTIDLSGWFISNSQTPLQKFRIAPGTMLTPGAFKVFDEGDFNADGSGTGTNFTLNSAHGDSIYLSQTDGAGNLTGYRAQVSFGAAENGVSFGRFATSVGEDFTAMAQRTLGASNGYPRIGPVIINEIMYHPNSGGIEYGEEEFIELHNASGTAVPMFDAARPTNVWKLSGGVSFNFSSAITIPAGGSLLLVDFDPAINISAMLNFRAKYGTNGTLVGPYSGRLNNAGEAIELYRPDAPQTAPHPDTNFVPMILVDRVNYSPSAPWPMAADGGGASLQRKASSLYGNEPLNWKAEPPTSGSTNVQGALVAPTVATQPTNRTVALNDSVSFTVVASGSVPLDYQWQHAGTNLPGGNSATLTISGAQLSDAGTYRVIVTNLAGNVTSQDAILTVLAPPTISTPPQTQTAVAGSIVQLSVTAIGTAPLHYQWRKDGADLNGQNAAQLTLNNVQPLSAGNYTVVITNIAGSITSSVAILTIIVPPTITSDPADATVFDGDSATFMVSATGTAPLTYQWRRNQINIPGANSASYTISAAHSSDEGLYSVFVTNVAGNATSLQAQLRVNSAPFLGSPKLRADGAFEFKLNGATNRVYAVEFTTNFTGWTNLTNFNLSSPQTTIIDSTASNANTRFYRVRTGP